MRLAGGALGVVLFVVLAIVVVALYFVPTIIAVIRHHHQIGPITVINLLLGWTFIGWVAALAFAVSFVPQR